MRSRPQDPPSGVRGSWFFEQNGGSNPSAVALWDEQARDHGMFDARHVGHVNNVCAVYAERYLFSNRSDNAIAHLAEKYKGSRIRVGTEGFDPEDLAPVEVARRSMPQKP